MLTAAPAGNGAEQAETGRFAQVLALLPAASPKPGPVMDAVAPVPVAVAALPVATPTLPESGKILPGALPRSLSLQMPSAIPAGIMAILSPPAKQLASPAPAPVVLQPMAATVQLAPSLPKPPHAPPAEKQRKDETLLAESDSKAPQVHHASAKSDRMALLRDATTLMARKAAPTNITTIAAQADEEQASERLRPSSADSLALPNKPLMIEAAAPSTLPVATAQMPEPSLFVEAPEAAVPSTVAAPIVSLLSLAKVQLPDSPLPQKALPDQQISTPAEPVRTHPQPTASAPKFELPIASLPPTRTPLAPASSLVIVPDAQIPLDLTITAPLRPALPRRAAILAFGEHSAAIAAPMNFSAPTEPLLRAAPVAAQRQTDDKATAPTQTLSAPTAPSPLAAPDISAPTIIPTQRPADFTQIVDRLIAARDAAGSGQAQPVNVNLSHAEFGKVSLRFSHDDGALSVALSSADPDFVRAAQIAASSPPQATDTNAGGSGSQPQSRSGESSAPTSNGQPQSGSNGSSSQRQPAPEIRTARGEPSRQPDKSEDEQAADRRHRFA